jgi:enoyl-CoA hydratase/carnithine racemase
LLRALTELEADATLQVLVLAGKGDHFSVGNDVNELAELDSEGASQLLAEWDEIARRLRNLPAIVIGQIAGYALGGGFELAMSCDLRVASEDASMACTAINFGLVMSTHTLSRSLTEPLAKELVLTGRQVDAAEALRLGLVTAVVPRSELQSVTDDLVNRLAARPRAALQHAKRLLHLAQELDRDAHDEVQRSVFATLASTPEHAKAVRGFLAM